jgi:hypothetical protein
LNAANSSGVGRKRSAVFGMRSASARFAISTFTFAVIPGLSFSCRFGTSMTVPYVVTFCCTTGCNRICTTVPSNVSVG